MVADAMTGQLPTIVVGDMCFHIQEGNAVSQLSTCREGALVWCELIMAEMTTRKVVEYDQGERFWMSSYDINGLQGIRSDSL